MLDEHSDGSSAALGQADRKSVFFSYRRLDDQPPPESPDADGFVRYLWRQLRNGLGRRGAAHAILWRDRGKIEPADDFTDKIMQALREADLFLAVLSRNYIDSPWCN